MTLNEIIENLIKNAKPLEDVESYSSLPGIYALFFIGDGFPLTDYQLPENRVIYIGKTITSQQSRDANTHFKTGRSGGVLKEYCYYCRWKMAHHAPLSLARYHRFTQDIVLVNFRICSFILK